MVLVKTLQVLLALSILIVIHEAGHFCFAKLFGIRVEKFFLFFDIGGFKLLSTKEGWFSRLFPGLGKFSTEYGIGWLPLGGYCKIAGMVDESLDTEQLRSEPSKDEFRTKPAWQRLLVMAGGVLFNFILAIILFICILGIWGESYISNEDSCIYAGQMARDMGFETGDHILDMDGYIPDNFGMLQADIARRSPRTVRVLRGLDTVTIYIDHSRIPDILNSPDMFSLAVPFVVDTIPPESPNWQGGLVRGDRIIGADSTEIAFLQDSRPVFARNRGKSITASVVRGADTLSLPIKLDTSGRAVIFAAIPGLKTRNYGAISAIPAGIKMAFSSVSGYLSDLKMVATPSTGAYKSVGSFISIGKVFPGVWDWYRFLVLLAMLSIMLGVMNLIPIPGLDGGHIMFTLYEMVTGRKPSERFLVIAQMIGMVLLMMLMMLAFSNDISSLLR